MACVDCRPDPSEGQGARLPSFPSTLDVATGIQASPNWTQIAVGNTGWFEIATVPGHAAPTGVTLSYDRSILEDCKQGRFLPCPPSGFVYFQQSGGTGTLDLKSWSDEAAQIVAITKAGTIIGSNPKASPTADSDPQKVAPAAAGTQLTGGVLAAGGATAPCTVIVSGDQNNPLGTFLARVQATAVALTGRPVYAAGEIEYVIPAGGKLWAASADGAQNIYFGVRT